MAGRWTLVVGRGSVRGRRTGNPAAREGEAERILRQGADKARVISAVTLPSGTRGPHLVLAVGARRRYPWSMGFVTDTDTNGGGAHLMRKRLTLSLALALTALLTVTGFVVYGDDWRGRYSARHDFVGPIYRVAPGDHVHERRTGGCGDGPTCGGLGRSDGALPAAQAPEPSDGGCNAAALRDAIAASGAVSDDVTFEISYLNCGEGYGWAQIVADYGEGATVLLKGSGADNPLLNLGSSVCAPRLGDAGKHRRPTGPARLALAWGVRPLSDDGRATCRQ